MHIMFLPILSCYRNSIKTIRTKNTIRLISNVPFNEAFTLNKYKDNLLMRKFNDVSEWYIKFTGLDEVKRLQDKVIITQERLERVQHERREKGKIIIEIRKDATLLQEQLHQVKKWENVQIFVDLTQKEAELIKKEREFTAQFEMLDKEERELFSTLCNTIRDSHEKEKAQSEYTKYWGIIGSIIGTIVGAVTSSIISTIRNKQIIIGINRNIEDKFNEIANMNQVNNLTTSTNADTNISYFRDESRDVSQHILKGLSQNLGEIKEFKRITILCLNDVMKLLQANLNDMTTIVNRNNKFLATNDESKKSVNKEYTYFNETQQFQETIPPVLLGFIGMFIVSVLCCCISR